MLKLGLDSAISPDLVVRSLSSGLIFSRESDSRDSVVRTFGRSYVRPSVRHAILKVL